MNALARRLSRLEERQAQRITARRGWDPKQVLFERIEAVAVRLRAGGYVIPEDGPAVDALRLEVEQRLALVLGSSAP